MTDFIELEVMLILIKVVTDWRSVYFCLLLVYTLPPLYAVALSGIYIHFSSYDQ